MLLPRTSAKDAEGMLRRMRLLASHPWSWGVTEMLPGEAVEVALRRADAEMYRDKRSS
ncbi:hypothetical protein [Microbacterium alcoholitolerans]|uniref:hypothetical protein n=1 Tax=unclassified Microbacterium TaxID=2609290 RepID=UPI003D17133A